MAMFCFYVTHCMYRMHYVFNVHCTYYTMEFQLWLTIFLIFFYLIGEWIPDDKAVPEGNQRGRRLQRRTHPRRLHRVPQARNGQGNGNIGNNIICAPCVL